jgi:hypothetical protein
VEEGEQHSHMRVVGAVTTGVSDRLTGLRRDQGALNAVNPKGIFGHVKRKKWCHHDNRIAAGPIGSLDRYLL